MENANTAEALAELTSRDTIWAMDENRHRGFVQALEAGGPMQAAVARRAEKPVVRGVGVLPLSGLITYRENILSQLFGGTAITTWRERFRELLEAKNVQAILIPVSSPGGGVFGVSELARQIYEGRRRKPVIAICDPFAASAAYWIASQATRVLSLRSGMCGSVGVFVVHSDVSEAEKKAGVRTRYISSSREKVELAPEKPLSKSAAAYLQKGVDETFKQFVADVALGRRTTVSDVRANFGRGRMLDGDDALRAGLVDALVDDPSESIKVVAELMAGRVTKRKNAAT